MQTNAIADNDVLDSHWRRSDGAVFEFLFERIGRGRRSSGFRIVGCWCHGHLFVEVGHLRWCEWNSRGDRR